MKKKPLSAEEAAAQERTCTKCNRLLPISLFKPRPPGRTGFYRHCYECGQKQVREYIAKNKEKYLRNAKKGRDKLSAIVREAKNKPCADCGIQYLRPAMHFDHRSGTIKKCNLSAPRGVGLVTVYEEIAKCDVVCANCHAVRTHRRGQHVPQKQPRVVTGLEI